METLRKYSRRQRMSKRAWLAGVTLHAVPFVISALAVFEPAVEQRMVMVGEQFLGAPLDALVAVHDRAGFRLAALDARGRVYAMVGEDRLTPQPALPPVAAAAEGRRLVWTDLDYDELQDLLVLPLWWAPAAAGPAGAWQLTTDMDPAWRRHVTDVNQGTTTPAMSLVNGDGDVFGLAIEDGQAGATMLYGGAGRPVARVAGVVALVADLDGAPGDELVTVSPGSDALRECVTRLYQITGREVRQVWRWSFRIADCVLRATGGDGLGSPLFHAADWDGDGNVTLVVGEPTRGRVSYWHWRAAAPASASRRLRTVARRASAWQPVRGSAAVPG